MKVTTSRNRPNHIPTLRTPAYAICSSDALVFPFVILLSSSFVSCFYNNDEFFRFSMPHRKLLPDCQPLEQGPRSCEEQEADHHPLDGLGFCLGEYLHAHNGPEHNAHEGRYHDHRKHSALVQIYPCRRRIGDREKELARSH